MKKISTILILCLVVCLSVAIFTGCESSYGPIGSTKFKDQKAENNGGLVVKQGDYLYYVNGMDSTSNISKPEDNAFGKASVKGSIMKSKIDAEGNLTETAVVVPKMFYTSAENGGFYIYGEWIYYLSPNTKTDNKSNVLSSQSVVARTKIDGTKTQEIITLSSNSIQYTFTEKEFIYYQSSKLKKVTYTNDKVEKKAQTIAKDVSSVLFTAKSSIVFYLKSTESKVRLNNNMYAYVNGKVKQITTDNTFDTEEDKSEENLSKQFTFDLLSYDAKENTLFYTKVSNSNDQSKKTSTYAYKFDENYTFDPTKEVRYSTTALSGSSMLYLGAEKGILDTSSARLQIYKSIAENATEDDIEKGANLSASGAEIIKIEGNTIYYILSNTLYMVVNYADKDAVVQKVSEDAISTSWLTRSLMGNYLYYIDNTYNYMYRVDITALVTEPNNYVYAEGSIVSGTRKATITKNDDGKIVIKYVSDNENKDDVKYYQLPKFMTKDDVQKYAEDIYEEEDDK